MRATARLLQHASRITLFTRENCGLCTQARSVLSDVWDARPFEYQEVDIIKSDSVPRWRDLYEFDVPVVRSFFPYPPGLAKNAFYPPRLCLFVCKRERERE